ncbi:Wzz/FepE/Etk N-terminal domain-containing protein [Polaribacter sp.]|nr:Wzz/FepE/Etk N-terminal domain-containing protein [Polaribacter sp.]
MESSKNNIEAEDQIDIIALLSKIWDRKKTILKTVAIFGVIGIFVALSTPNKYTALSMFTPNYSGASSGSSGLKGLASLAGINIGSSSESSKEISPMLYGKILESAVFKKELLEAPLKNLGTVKTLRAYFIENTSTSVLGTVKEYTIGLPSKIIGLFKKESTATIFAPVDGIQTISEQDFEYFKAIDNILSISINDKDGYIEMVGESENPQIAAQVAKNAELILQNQIIAIKTKSSLELLKYLEEQYAAKKVLLRKAQNELSRFKDRNLNIATSSFSNNQTRLASELQTANAVFDNVVQQLEAVKFQVTKDTPVFSIIKPVVVPNEKSEPKRSLILVVWLFLGAVCSIGFVLAKEPVQNLLKEIKKESIS